jgi:putative hydrolase of the HAD superfamily
LDLVKGAVLLDALGTLVELQPPAPRLRAVLAAEGFPVAEERAGAAFRAEISYYLEHHLEGGTREGLDELRDRCAAILLEALALPGLDHAVARRSMLAALEFTPYPDAVPALRALRDGGRRLAIVSNWDCSLEDWLEPTGLVELVDGLITSAATGAAKPDPAIFQTALELLGAEREHAVHVGDSLDKDVAGARAAGVRAILVARGDEAPAGVEAVGTLAELPSLL